MRSAPRICSTGPSLVCRSSPARRTQERPTGFGLKGERALDKSHPLVQAVKAWVDEEYAGGRVTVISNGELEHVSAREAKNLGVDLTD